MHGADQPVFVSCIQLYEAVIFGRDLPYLGPEQRRYMEVNYIEFLAIQYLPDPFLHGPGRSRLWVFPSAGF